MNSKFEELYTIDEDLAANKSVKELIHIMNPHYRVSELLIDENTASKRVVICKDITRSTIHDTKFHVGKIDDNILGIWPSEGPVWELDLRSTSMEIELERGTLRKKKNYAHDERGKAMISYDVMKQHLLKDYGVEQILPYQEIRLYLEPK